MSAFKEQKLISAIEHAAAEFINRESNRTSLITVTRAELRADKHTINVFISVLPDYDTGAAVDFLSRQGHEFSEFLKKKIRTHSLPHIVFLADPERNQLSKTP